MVECPIRHLGTEEGYKIYQKLQNHLEDDHVNLLFNTMVESIIVKDGNVTGIKVHNGEEYFADHIVCAVEERVQTGLLRSVMK